MPPEGSDLVFDHRHIADDGALCQTLSFPLFRCARTRLLAAGFVFLATAMIVDADG
jgi:hypothetical protein